MQNLHFGLFEVIWVYFHLFGYKKMVIRDDGNKDKRMGLRVEKVGVNLG